MSEVECVWPVGAILGEGPHWSAAEQALWFVDIKSPAIHRFDPASGEKRSWPAPARCGFLLPTSQGWHVAGLKNGLHRFNAQTGNFSQPCWCHNVDFPPELMQRVPPELRGQACICARCAQAASGSPQERT